MFTKFMQPTFTPKLGILMLMLISCFSLTAQDYNIVERSHMDWPGQTLANICGYVSPDGKEYALVGGSQGLIIVDVSNPDAPVEIVQIPGVNNLWKEIKVYKHYAYVTSEGGTGVQIVDLSGLPSATLTYHSYTGTGGVTLNRIHALHIDTTKGFVYLFGGDQTGATIHALQPDPYNPTYAGEYQAGGYVHDGYVNNDTLYAGHIYAGLMTVVDCTNKAAPVVLGSVLTPNSFTHNVWPLTSNRHIMLTTDERSNTFLAAFDTQDPANILELDRIQPTPGSGSIVHNTHIRNNFAVTSWYTDGVTIVDATRPTNLIQVGRFDTFLGSGDGFDGCWGAFPFFPSGTILTTNIGSDAPNDPTRLYVLTPTYKRACYFEGVVTDGCTGLPLKDAIVKIVSNDPLAYTNTNAVGIYRTGQPTPGTFAITVEKLGYITYTANVVLSTAQITNLNITLEKSSTFSSTATATISTNGGAPQIMANRVVRMMDPLGAVSTVTTDAQGKVTINCVTAGAYKFGVWGAKNVISQTITAAGSISLAFQSGYYDDFEMDLGWASTATSTSGNWIRAEPVGTQLDGADCNPNQDVSTDTNDQCYTTGNLGGQPGNDDVDNGNVVLRTPLMLLSTMANPTARFRYWFCNGGGNTTANDRFDVVLSNGTSTATLRSYNTPAQQWNDSGEIPLTGVLPITNQMSIEFIAYDDLPGHVVEAAIDIFVVQPSTVGTFEPTLQATLVAQPNPFTQSTTIQYQLLDAQSAILEITDIVGKVVATQVLDNQSGTAQVGRNLNSGMYFVRLRNAAGVSAATKIVKQ
jgi:choice-of-anchor B domain-containing protein